MFTEKQFKQIEKQIPDYEVIVRVYRAFEGDLRVIAYNTLTGAEKRYTCIYDGEGNIFLEVMI